MNFIKKSLSVLLAVLLCGAMIIPVFADEADDQFGDIQKMLDSQQENQEPEETEPSSSKYSSTVADQHFTEVNETVYAVASVNVRMNPGTQYKILGRLPYGYSVTRIGVSSSGWSMVLWEDQVAYIFSTYLSTVRPKEYNSKIDDTALLHQIAIANGLTRADYTQESWQVVSDALVKANSALNGTSQGAADDAQKALAKAIDGLVKMNYSELEQLLAEVENMALGSAMTELWYELVGTAMRGRELLASGDQASVDIAVEQIRTMIVLVRDEMNKMDSPEIVIQEVPVEVPPADDFCNIPVHRMWPVLFFVSLALNVVLVVTIVVYIRNKKKNQTDDTPLVDYDIFDDTF